MIPSNSNSQREQIEQAIAAQTLFKFTPTAMDEIRTSFAFILGYRFLQFEMPSSHFPSRSAFILFQARRASSTDPSSSIVVMSPGS